MLVPALGARMKEPTDLAGVRVDPRDVGPLEQIATTTRESEVVFRIGSTMLTGNNVLDVEAVITLISSQVAVLALILGPLGYLNPGARIYQDWMEGPIRARAFACRIAMKSPMRTSNS